MNPSVFITALCGAERDSWLHPKLVESMIAATHDSRQHQRPVALDLTLDYRPVDRARNAAVEKFLKSPCQWLCMVDNDNPPRFRILDFIKAAEEQGAFIVGAPTPMHGAQWNFKCDNSFSRTLPREPWFRVHLIGTGFLAVRRCVFESIAAPWFVSQYDMTEDVAFMKRAHEAGFQAWASSKFLCSHFKSVDLFDLMRTAPQ